MKILHVLSQFEVTGAEVYAAVLMEEQAAHGHATYVVSNTVTVPMRATVFRQAIGKRSYGQRFRNIRWLIKVIRNEQIDVLHAHSRAASWVGYWACRWTGAAFVSTVHGRQHIHASSRSFNVYGRYIIAVCESVKEHLVGDLNVASDHITVIRNGLSLKPWMTGRTRRSRKKLYKVSASTKVLLSVGRFSGPKGALIRGLVSQVYPLIRAKIPTLFCIAGGRAVPEDLQELADQFNRESKDGKILFAGFQPRLADHIKAADVVIGSGRVAMEALAAGKPLVAVGESEYHGLVRLENVARAFETNFGDTGKQVPIDFRRVADDVIRVLSRGPNKAELAELRNTIARECDSKFVSTAVQKVYKRALIDAALPRAIPILMYHRVLPKHAPTSSHGIWVTTDQFEHQLISLRQRGFSGITFSDLMQVGRGEGKLPQRPVMLTFDDGYEDNYHHAFPLLQKYGFSAVIYAVTHPTRRKNFWDADQPQVNLLTRKQMQEMAQWGIEFGSHTLSHLWLPDAAEALIRRELTRSKEWLEGVLGMEVTSFAYPYGALNRRVKALVKEAGYRFAAAAESGPFRLQDDVLEIRRTQVFPWTSRFGYWKKTQAWYYRYKSHGVP